MPPFFVEMGQVRTMPDLRRRYDLDYAYPRAHSRRKEARTEHVLVVSVSILALIGVAMGFALRYWPSVENWSSRTILPWWHWLLDVISCG
jgi:hypothetical protein